MKRIQERKHRDRGIFLPFLAAALLLVVAACGGVTGAELTELGEPLISAHDALEDLQVKVNSGLSRGDFLSEWPDVAAEVSRALDDYYESVPSGLSEVDKEELDAYASVIETAVKGWDVAALDTRAVIDGYGDDELLQQLMDLNELWFDALDIMKEAALTPGPAPEEGDAT